MSSWLPQVGIPSIMKRSKSHHAALVSTGSKSSQHRKHSLCVETLPEVEGESEILLPEEISFLSEYFPARVLGAPLHLTFSTSRHGFSLASVYRHFQAVSSPTLLVIQDTEGAVFGALLSQPIRLNEHFYGTGESFLFRLRPSKNTFTWSGDNLLFIQGTSESLIIGAGEGHFGIFIDNNLYQGRTQSCSTFHNEPLTSSGDFTIKALEAWTFS